MGGDSNYFAQQVPYFSRFRRVIAMDTRGHGKSPRGTAPFSIRQFAEDLLHFLDEQNLPQVDLLGFFRWREHRIDALRQNIRIVFVAWYSTVQTSTHLESRRTFSFPLFWGIERQRYLPQK